MYICNYCLHYGRNVCKNHVDPHVKKRFLQTFLAYLIQ